MRDDGVGSTIEDGVLRLILTRPERMNVLTVDSRKRILELLKSNVSNPEVRCVVISSQGKAFSAGADMNHLLTLSKQGARGYAKFVRSFLGYLESYPKPTIGLVDGVAVGGGLELLLSLDLVIASNRARFGQTELNVGLIPGGGGSQRLPRAVGVRKAKEMIYTGDLISADEALRSGLVNRVVLPEELEAEASRLTARIKAKSTQKLALVKRAVNEGMRGELEAGLRLESALYADVLHSQETKKEIRAFLDKNTEKQT